MNDDPRPSRSTDRLVRRIDRFTEITGMVFSWLMVPLVLAVAYEVIARYAFNAPTVWAYDVSYMLYGSIFMLGAAFALRKGAHIRTDFFWEKWSPRTKGYIDAIAYIGLFFPALSLLLWIGYQDAMYAFQIDERAEATAWRPALWPLKAVVPVSAFLLLVQGVAEAVKSVYAARTGVEFEHRERFEV